MVSRPSQRASATKPMRRRTAPRTRISAVVSWRRRSRPVSRITRPARRSVMTTSAATSPKPASSITVLAVEDACREKNRASRSTAPKSPTEAPEITSWPNVLLVSPASLSTGITRPSEVASRMMASSSGLPTRPSAPIPDPDIRARPIETRNARPVSFRIRPRSRSKDISMPARKRRNARPMSERIWTGRSTRSQPISEGPSTMPARISTTTAGNRSAGKSPSVKGAAKATAVTSSRSPKETSGNEGPPHGAASITAGRSVLGP